MSIYPENVQIAEENLKKITAFFQESYKRIIKEIETATDFGIANRKAILKEIDSTLLELSDKMQNFIDDDLPTYYKSGAEDAVSQLKNIGADIKVTTGFNKLHKEAIVALVDDTVRSYNEAITGVKRSADLLLGRSFREMVTNEIAFGQVTGESLARMRRNIKGILKEQGLSAITDKSGKKWQLDSYAEMLYRTKTVEARNIGLTNRLAENGYDLAQVSAHVTSCDLCAPWQGKIISITGKTKGYPTLADAQKEGLFHPNCRHAINVLIPSLASKTKAYDIETKKYTKKVELNKK